MVDGSTTAHSEVIEYTVYEYILIISERQSTNFMSPVVFNLCMK